MLVSPHSTEPRDATTHNRPYGPAHFLSGGSVLSGDSWLVSSDINYQAQSFRVTFPGFLCLGFIPESLVFNLGMSF